MWKEYLYNLLGNVLLCNLLSHPQFTLSFEKMCQLFSFGRPCWGWRVRRSRGVTSQPPGIISFLHQHKQHRQPGKISLKLRPVQWVGKYPASTEHFLPVKTGNTRITNRTDGIKTKWVLIFVWPKSLHSDWESAQCQSERRNNSFNSRLIISFLSFSIVLVTLEDWHDHNSLALYKTLHTWVLLLEVLWRI